MTVTETVTVNLSGRLRDLVAVTETLTVNLSGRLGDLVAVTTTLAVNTRWSSRVRVVGRGLWVNQLTVTNTVTVNARIRPFRG